MTGDDASAVILAVADKVRAAGSAHHGWPGIR